MTREEKIGRLRSFCDPARGCHYCVLNNIFEFECLSKNWADFTEAELDAALLKLGYAPERLVDKVEPDMVNKATHYQLPGGLECWDVMVAMFGEEQVRVWCNLNAFAYLFQYAKKNGEEDIFKELFNLQKYFELAGEDE